MVGPLKRAPGGFEYIYVAIDKFTKWIDYKSLLNFNAIKAVEFMQDIMYCFGIFNRIITDLGSPFIAIEFRIGSKIAALASTMLLLHILKLMAKLKG